MRYRSDPKSGNKLSILGFGCMRFPRKLSQINLGKTEELVLYAAENGVNYFDTAYIYPGSEDALGQILKRNSLRRQIFLATKLPLMNLKSRADFERIFSEQLGRLQTDYIDYYFLHNLSGLHIWERLRAMGIEEWLHEKKTAGQIKQIGFSFHGIQGEFFSLLETRNWDFCQIQYNYVGVNYQAGRAGLRRAAEKGLPVFIMAPLLGGKLAEYLPEKAMNVFKAADSSLSPAAWGLRWLWNQPEVTMVLSGMSEMRQLDNNIKTANGSYAGMLTENEQKIYEAAVTEFSSSFKIPCTGCNYCMPCPQKINIPGIFSAYNLYYTLGTYQGIRQYASSTGFDGSGKQYSPSRCVKCGICEKHCPQNIEIINWLGEAQKKLEPFWLKYAMLFINKFIRKV